MKKPKAENPLHESAGVRFSCWVKSMKKDSPFLLMCLPAILFFLIFSYLPMPGIYIAFTDFNYNKGIFGSDFVGLENLRFITMTGQLGTLVRNTVLYNIAFIVTSNLMQIGLAILLNEIRSRSFRKISQSVMILPNFISFVLVGLFAFGLFNYDYGVVNTLREGMGMDPIAVYSQSELWPLILILTNLWKGVGYGTIVYFAALMGIDSGLLEAAQLDGATTFQRIRYIILPHLRPTVVILILLSIGGILRGNFDLFYNMVGSNNIALLDTTDVIETFVFRSMVNNNDFTTAAAVSFVQSIFGFILVLTSNAIVKKVEPDYALF